MLHALPSHSPLMARHFFAVTLQPNDTLYCSWRASVDQFDINCVQIVTTTVAYLL